MGAEPSSRLKGKIPDGWLPISHTEVAMTIPQLRLCALCDSDKVKLEQVGKLYKIANIYTDYKLLIDEVRPDFLCIATRTLGRTDIMKYACENGVKIIYLEKPISRSIGDCRNILNICKKYGVIIGYGVNRRYHSAYRKAKEIMCSGKIGKLREIIVEHGRSNLLWTHSHSADVIQFFAESSELEFIQGTCTFSDGYYPVTELLIDDDPIVENAFMKFKNGITASINQTGGINVRLSCTNGILTIYADGTYIEILKGSGYFSQRERIQVESLQSATITAFQELIDSLNNEKPKPITPAEIETGMLILHGIVYSSLNNGKRIAPEVVPEQMTITGKSGKFYA
ncbi:MAG: hypothetical protein A2Y40_01045 [Candidatus Margulisbacteria bacterium GWF2_35_9]|nr:MAG: hypothetical protein A2Y40_01045 [Candidatus Margulisbacteria bacterium GWF2_35_9]